MKGRILMLYKTDNSSLHSRHICTTTVVGRSVHDTPSPTHPRYDVPPPWGGIVTQRAGCTKPLAFQIAGSTAGHRASEPAKSLPAYSSTVNIRDSEAIDCRRLAVHWTHSSNSVGLPNPTASLAGTGLVLAGFGR